MTASDYWVQVINSSLVGWTKAIKSAYSDGFPVISSNKVYYPRESVKMSCALQIWKPGARYCKGYEHRDHRNYRQTINISRTLAGNMIVDHSDVVSYFLLALQLLISYPWPNLNADHVKHCYLPGLTTLGTKYAPKPNILFRLNQYLSLENTPIRLLEICFNHTNLFNRTTFYIWPYQESRCCQPHSRQIHPCPTFRMLT